MPRRFQYQPITEPLVPAEPADPEQGGDPSPVVIGGILLLQFIALVQPIVVPPALGVVDLSWQSQYPDRSARVVSRAHLVESGIAPVLVQDLSWISQYPDLLARLVSLAYITEASVGPVEPPAPELPDLSWSGIYPDR